MLYDLFLPNIAYASLDSFITNVNKLIINPLIILMFSLALVYFLFGMFQFVRHSDDEGVRSEGKQHMLWGVIGFVIMFGVFTILKIVLDTFNIKGIDVEERTVEFPEFKE